MMTAATALDECDALAGAEAARLDGDRRRGTLDMAHEQLRRGSGWRSAESRLCEYGGPSRWRKGPMTRGQSGSVVGGMRRSSVS